jgi:hypothetical protein
MRLIKYLFPVLSCIAWVSCSKKGNDKTNPLIDTIWSGRLTYLATPYDPAEPFSLSFIGEDSAVVETKDGLRPGSYTFNSDNSRLELKLKGYDQLISATLKSDSLSNFTYGASMNLQLRSAARFTGISGTVAGSKWVGNVTITFTSSTQLGWGPVPPAQVAYTIKGNVLRFKRNNTYDGSFGVFSGNRLDGCDWQYGNVTLWLAYRN